MNKKEIAIYVIATFLLGPVIGMFILNRGFLALFYLIVPFALVVAGYAGGFSLVDLYHKDSLVLIVSAFHIAGFIHCMILLRGFDKPDNPKFYARWYFLLLFIIVMSVSPHIIRAFLYEPFNAPSGSMIPGLQQGDNFFVSKFEYGYGKYHFPLIKDRIIFSKPQYGDMIVFKHPKKENVDYVKRIVGVSGDKIQVIDGVLYINDKKIPKIHIKDNVYREIMPNGKKFNILDMDGSSKMDNTEEFIVNDGYYFVLGDNRDNSLDSRSIGLIPEGNILGKATYIYWNDVENVSVRESIE